MAQFFKLSFDQCLTCCWLEARNYSLSYIIHFNFKKIMQAFPVTVKRSIELIGLFILGYLIYIGADIITPILMAFFIAIVLLPVYRFLRRLRFPEVLAISCSILLLVLIVV